MVTTLMLTLNYRVDTLMMGYLYHIPDTEIGFYSLGVSLSEYGWLIPDAFREVLFSRTAKDDAIEEVTMSMKVNFYLTLLMILGILLLGRPVIRILAGAEYLPAYPVTVMLIAGIIPMSYFKIIGTLLLAQGKKGVYLGMLSASVLVNILLQYAHHSALGQDGRGGRVRRLLRGGGFCVPRLLPQDVQHPAKRRIRLQPGGKGQADEQARRGEAQAGEEKDGVKQKSEKQEDKRQGRALCVRAGFGAKPQERKKHGREANDEGPRSVSDDGRGL